MTVVSLEQSTAGGKFLHHLLSPLRKVPFSPYVKGLLALVLRLFGKEIFDEILEA
jgi:hypothetical protein